MKAQEITRIEGELKAHKGSIMGAVFIQEGRVTIKLWTSETMKELESD